MDWEICNEVPLSSTSQFYCCPISSWSGAFYVSDIANSRGIESNIWLVALFNLCSFVNRGIKYVFLLICKMILEKVMKRDR